MPTETAHVRHSFSRAGAFSIVVLLHVAVLSVSWQRAAPERKDQHVLTWVNVEPESEIPATKSEPNPRPRQQNFRVRSSPPVPTIEPAPSAISVPPIDWQASMEAATGSAVAEIIRREGTRPLGPTERGASGSSDRRSIFEQPKHKAGDIEYDSVQGRTYVWHNKDCYTELRFPTIKDPNAIIGAPNAPKCRHRLGTLSPRDDLFDEMKPR
jgi:hypothetical protein